MSEALRPKWRALVSPSAAVDVVFDDLLRRYAEPHRFYHTLGHITRLLNITRALQSLVPSADWPAVQLAVWFHDAVYDTQARDNEEQSARLAERTLANLSLPVETIEKTARLIRATKTHEMNDGDAACAVMLDADLEILGADEIEYDAYARAIRREYAWVAERDWQAGRSRVLENFLARECLYQTNVMRQEREMAARRNLARELQALSV